VKDGGRVVLQRQTRSPVLNGLVIFTILKEGSRAVREWFRVVGLQRDRLPKIPKSIFFISFFAVYQPSVVIRMGVVGLQSNRLVIILKCMRVVT